MPSPMEQYLSLIEPLRETARRLGYALTVHGSIARDIDLVAIPWATTAVSEIELAESLRVTAESVCGSARMTELEYADEWFRKGCQPYGKPHGRRCWCYHIEGTYIDLSVMPTYSSESVMNCLGEMDDQERDDLIQRITSRYTDKPMNPSPEWKIKQTVWWVDDEDVIREGKIEYVYAKKRGVRVSFQFLQVAYDLQTTEIMDARQAAAYFRQKAREFDEIAANLEQGFE